MFLCFVQWSIKDGVETWSNDDNLCLSQKREHQNYWTKVKGNPFQVSFLVSDPWFLFSPPNTSSILQQAADQNPTLTAWTCEIPSILRCPVLCTLDIEHTSRPLKGCSLDIIKPTKSNLLVLMAITNHFSQNPQTIQKTCINNKVFLKIPPKHPTQGKHPCNVIHCCFGTFGTAATWGFTSTHLLSILRCSDRPGEVVWSSVFFCFFQTTFTATCWKKCSKVCHFYVSVLSSLVNICVSFQFFPRRICSCSKKPTENLLN